MNLIALFAVAVAVAAAANRSTAAADPIHRFVFVKVHKTGGSTLASTLHRRVWHHNLTVALPWNFVRFPDLFASTSDVKDYEVLVRNNGPVRVVMNHLRFTPATAAFLRETLIPAGSHTRYFSILRRPWESFISHFCYYRLERSVNALVAVAQSGIPPLPVMDNNSGAGCIDALSAYVSGFSRHYGQLSVLQSLGMVNPQAVDLGLAPALWGVTGQDAAAAATTLIHRLDTQLDLVLITEHFDESMVLLKRLMRWQLDDLVYVSLKTAVKLEGKKRDDKTKLVAAAAAALTAPLESTGEMLARRLPPGAQTAVQTSLLAIDDALYQHYNATFWRKIAAEGPGFHDELAHFRTLQKAFLKRCTSEPQSAACTLSSWDNPVFSDKLNRKYGLPSPRGAPTAPSNDETKQKLINKKI